MYINNRVIEVTICAFVKRTKEGKVRLGAYGSYCGKGVVDEFGETMNDAGVIREPKSMIDVCIEALENSPAINSSHKNSELRIKTAIRPIFSLIQDFKNTGFGRYQSRKGIDRLREILEGFDKVSVKLVREYRNASGKLRQARLLALDDFDLKEDSTFWKNGIPRVYTDGACRRNGQEGAVAGGSVFWGPDDPRNASFTISGPQTNNRGEYSSVIYALEQALAARVLLLIICVDTQLLIDSIYNYLPKWKENGWKTRKGGPVKNRDLVERIDELMGKMEYIYFEKVLAHSGNEGNEGADQEARKATGARRR